MFKTPCVNPTDIHEATSLAVESTISANMAKNPEILSLHQEIHRRNYKLDNGYSKHENYFRFRSNGYHGFACKWFESYYNRL